MRVSKLICTSVLLADCATAAINESRLWLPRAQHELKPQLVQAAQLAATAEECAEVISGEFDTDRSEANEPVFRVVCRNPAGYTYSVYVTNAGKPNSKVEKVQDGTAAAGASVTGKSSEAKGADRSAVDDKTASKNCVSALKRRTTQMTGIQLGESNLQRLASAPGETRYEMDFDAADPSGMALHFHAVCRVSASGTALVEIRPRRAEKAQPSPKPTEPASTEPKATDDDGWEVME